MLESPLFKRFLVISIFIISAGIYDIIFIPEVLRNISQIAIIGVIISLLLIDYFAGGDKSIKQNFKYEVFLFLISTLLSMFIANAYHGQNFQTTLIAQRYMYFYFFYFFLHSMKPDIRNLEKVIMPLALIYAVFYLLQYFLYPIRLFDVHLGVTRGTIRVWIPGGSFMLLAYYKSLQGFMRTQKIQYALYCLLFFIITGILQGTRQNLATISLFTLAFILFSKQVKSRALLLSLSAIAGIAILIIFQDIFIELLALTQKQASDKDTNIRIVAMNFFMTEFMPSKLAYIFGNGQDSLNSSYGKAIAAYKAMGLYQSDIGLIGDYSKFGILFVIAQLSIVFRLGFGKLPKDLEYLRYYFISRLLVMFSGGNMFGRPEGIAFVMIVLYMVDLYLDKEKKEKPETETSKGANKLQYPHDKPGKTYT